mmetsp:Transcript_13137/g.48754  ORF Transcript_13137/g.48754 Transcript_13137/m.48754 type:complete len:91 (+) Transcript_13137:1380-1652(+)
MYHQSLRLSSGHLPELVCDGCKSSTKILPSVHLWRNRSAAAVLFFLRRAFLGLFVLRVLPPALRRLRLRTNQSTEAGSQHMRGHPVVHEV